jgi:hypothetical protein
MVRETVSEWIESLVRITLLWLVLEVTQPWRQARLPLRQESLAWRALLLLLGVLLSLTLPNKIVSQDQQTANKQHEKNCSMSHITLFKIIVNDDLPFSHHSLEGNYN